MIYFMLGIIIGLLIKIYLILKTWPDRAVKVREEGE